MIDNEYKYPTVEISSPDFEKESLALFQEHGYVILSGIRDMENFLSVGKDLFGDLDCRHIRANEFGITTVSNKGNLNNYLATTNKAHPLHTDGPYENPPPEIVGLMCVNQALIGGESILVHSKNIYDYLINELLVEKEILKEELLFIRDTNESYNRLITELEDGQLFMTYRYDKIIELKCSKEHEFIMKSIHYFINLPENQIYFKLKPGQALFLDNGSIIHGRTKFSSDSNRLMYRIWLKRTDAKISLGFKAS